MPKVKKKSTPLRHKKKPPPVKTPKGPRTLTQGQLEDRTQRVHRDSPIYLTMRDPFGFLIRAPLTGVRITMSDTGQKDFVELLVGL